MMTVGRSASPKKVQHDGSLDNAIRSQMPEIWPVELAAEEFVDTVLHIEVTADRIPIGVCSPVHTPEWVVQKVAWGIIMVASVMP